jgi:hypothetical protein
MGVTFREESTELKSAQSTFLLALKVIEVITLDIKSYLAFD